MRAVNFSFLSILFLFWTTAVKSQSGEYFIGSSSVSIEPDQSTFSLALAGYGAPRDGRFSITWEKKEDMPESILSVTGIGSKLYAINQEKELLVKDVLNNSDIWTKLGNAKDVICLSGYKDKLYAITSKNELVCRIASQKGASWKNIGSAANSTALTIVNDRIYASTTGNELLVRNLISNRGWKKAGTLDSVVCLAGMGERIYAVTANNNLWMAKTNASSISWTKIGRYIKPVADVNFQKIAIANNRLYAISNDNKLYLSRHNTDGELSARALAVKKGTKTVVIVGFDVCGFDYTLATEIRNIVYKKRKIPPAAIFLNGSHTHFAPVTQEFPAFGDHGQIPDSIYLNSIVKKGIVKAIESALDNMSPANLSFGRGETNIGHNRSSEDRKNPYDHSVDVLRSVSKNKGQSNILFLTACHPVFKNEGKEGYTISANYPGVAKKIIEEKESAQVAIFLQGCAGDINPAQDSHDKTGADLAMDVDSVLNGNMQKITGNISFSLDTIQVPANPWSKEKVEQFKIDNSNKTGNVGAEKNVRWANMMLQHYERNDMPKAIPVYVQTINIGNWKLIGLSREVVTAYSFAIKNIWPDQLVSVAGYTNEVPSYLPAESHIKRKTYEGYDSFFWNAQPSLFPENILDIVVEQIKTKNR